MQGVWYAAVVAAFLLGVLFLVRRGPVIRSRHTAEQPVPSVPTVDVDALAESARRVAEAEANSIRQVAQAEAEALRREAAGEAVRLTEQRQRAEHELAGATARLENTENRLEAQAARLDADGRELDRAIAALAEQRRDLDEVRSDLDHQRRLVADRIAELDRREAELDTRAGEHQRELERIAALSAEQARAELLSSVEATARRDAAVLVRTIENDARTEGTERARNIVVEAVQRVASEQTTETVVSVLHLPADEMKGRIIGREGRNIRAFESVTGVNVIIDDTPEAVLLSCFDPVRREIGRLTLERLILDGRIHPQRIEDVYEQSKTEIDELCLRAARDALADVGIGDLDERLLPVLGRLKYRTSYGQNVLGHLVETAHIAGVMAAELGIEPTLVKRCAFLHDIGKALTHEVEGSHAIIGADLLRRHGESEAVAHAVEAHHNEVPPQTVEAVLTQASDTCSAARPGARRESLENYVKRLARIEEIATSRPGVEKVFAMQSGREVRVMVQPTEVDDLAASVIAREIAKQIEDELTYPGQIRVTVVRESRTTEIAH
jgi:ribonuclease Y